MKRLALVFALFVSLFGQAQAAAIQARVLTMDGGEGDCLLNGKPLKLGQKLKNGSRIEVLAHASLILALTQGSSLALAGPGELTLLEGRVSLLSGTLNLVVAKPLQVQTPNALALLLSGEAQLSCGPAETYLSVDQGEAQLSDPAKKRTERLQSLQGARLFDGRLSQPLRLSKSEASVQRTNGERLRLFHGQGQEILKHLN